MIRDYLSEEAEKKIIERFNSMDFHCIFCNNPNPLEKTNVHCEQERLNFHPPGQDMSPYNNLRASLRVTTFLICPQCKNKFFVNILDQGKII
jgi:hypothetical protein